MVHQRLRVGLVLARQRQDQGLLALVLAAEVLSNLQALAAEKVNREIEKDMLVDALKTTRGNRTRAASLLRTTERVINYKIRKYRINPNGFRFV